MKINKPLKFKFMEDIVWYDGPLLSLGITTDNQPILEVWCDLNREENYNLYAYVFMQDRDLDSFIEGKKSYYSVICDSLNIVTWKHNGNDYDFEEVALEYFLPNYGPQPHSNLENDLVEFRQKYEEFKAKEQL